MSNNYTKYNKDFGVSIWLFAGAIFTAFIVIIGGITRLTGSGLSITEWNVISGIIPPLNEAAWKEIFDLYRATPEYQKINYGMSLEEFRWIYFWEYLHRLLARGLGILFIVPFIIFLWLRKFNIRDIYPLAVLFLLGVLQAFAGWWMVKSGLVITPYVSHFRLAFHLVLAFAISGMSLYLAFKWWPFTIEKSFKTQSWIKKATVIFLAILTLQIAWGAFVAGLKAGYAYPSWPMMGSGIIPAEIGMQKSLWADITYNPVTVQFIHRWLAFLLIPIPAIIWWKVRRSPSHKHLHNPASLLFGLILFQILTGILTLILHIPATLALIHQLIALFIVWTALWLLSRS